MFLMPEILSGPEVTKERMASNLQHASVRIVLLQNVKICAVSRKMAYEVRQSVTSHVEFQSRIIVKTKNPVNFHRTGLTPPI